MRTNLEHWDRAETVSDRVFQTLYGKIQSLDLAPGDRLSEAEVAKDFGISRQPVRDAFQKLAKQGFLDIRPQRATRVSLISTKAILTARFMRLAAELEIVRTAARMMTSQHARFLELHLDRQARLIERGDTVGFRQSDDAFHQDICRICGHPDVWASIAENKAHTDRLRLLCIRDGSTQALEDHRAIFDAMTSGDPARAALHMRQHLGRIKDVMEELRHSRKEWFALEDDM